MTYRNKNLTFDKISIRSAVKYGGRAWSLDKEIIEEKRRQTRTLSSVGRCTQLEK
jgi:hypothetical protein